MIQLLAKIFLKEKADVHKEGARTAYGVLCGFVGILLNIILFVIKFLAGYISGSIAITADAFNNLSDAGSSLITFLGFKLASQKPDPEHPFGHGRMEYISGLLVSIVIITMAYELIKDSITRIITPEPVEFSPILIIVLGISILVKLYMALYNYRFGKKLDSQAMIATAKDSLSDIISTSVILVCTLIGHYTTLSLDAYCGLIVGLLIAYIGINSIRETISPLLGTPPTKEFVKSIEKIVMDHEGVYGIHDLIVHDYGPGRRMISLHVEVPYDGNILEIHDTMDLIEHELREQLGCMATIHMDPVMYSDEATMQLKNAAADILKGIDSSLSLHDFRIVKGPTHTNILFDVLKPYRFKMTNEELKAEIQKEFTKIDESYFTVIEIDNDFNSMM